MRDRSPLHDLLFLSVSDTAAQLTQSPCSPSHSLGLVCLQRSRLGLHYCPFCAHYRVRGDIDRYLHQLVEHGRHSHLGSAALGGGYRQF